MIIGCDLDSTLVDLSNVICNKINKELGYHYKTADILDWYWECFPKDYRDRSNELYKDPIFMTSIPPFAGAIEKLIEWNKQGHKLYVLTARSTCIAKQTKEYVKSLFSTVDETFVVGNTEDKKDLMESLKLNFWIDDSPKGAKISLDLGISTYLISNEESPYNWKARSYTGIHVVSAVKDIVI
jgi:5'(3')-deoxyribonucleotidase